MLFYKKDNDSWRLVMNTSKKCPFCGKDIDAEAVKCPFCKEYLYIEKMPDELKRYNWGAFLLTFFWGIGNKKYLISLLVFLLGFIPLIGGLVALGFSIWCGTKGNEWAWQSKSWKDVNEFNKVQKRWVVASLIITIIITVLVAISTTTKLMKATIPAQARTECKYGLNTLDAAVTMNTQLTGKKLSNYRTSQAMVNMLTTRLKFLNSTKTSITLQNGLKYEFKINGTCNTKSKNCLVKIITSDPSKDCSCYLDSGKNTVVVTPTTSNWLDKK